MPDRKQPYRSGRAVRGKSTSRKQHTPVLRLRRACAIGSTSQFPVIGKQRRSRFDRLQKSIMTSAAPPAASVDSELAAD